MSKNDTKALARRIEHEASSFSETYKLDVKRVVKVLHKLAELNWYDPDHAIYGELEKAFQYLSPVEALELFEKEDLTRLATRVLLVEYLNARTTPFYTLDKLADLTKEFIDHLHENKDHLLKTGFPELPFNKSLWLDKHLNKLYYVKMPEKVHELVIPSRGRRKGKLKNVYSWNEETADHNMKTSLIIANTIEELKQYRGKKDTDSRCNYDICSMVLKAMLQEIELNINAYKEAPLIQGLTEEDAVKIESIRSKLFDLKVNVLEKLHHAVKNKRKYKLIADCVRIVNKYLTAEEVNFLLKKDHFYTNVVYGEMPSHSNNSLIYHNAGLSDLFMIIGHFYKELELSTMDEVYESLGELPNKKIPKSYYEAVGKPWQDDLNLVLCFYLCLEERDKTFWNRYNHQINNMISHSSIGHRTHAIVSLLQTDTEPIYMDIESFVAKYTKDDAFKQIVNNGKRAIVLMSELPPKKAVRSSGVECIFRKMGKGWYILYKDKEAFFKHYIGFDYLANVLIKQQEDFGASALYNYVKNYSRTSSSLSKTTEIELQNVGLTKSGGTNEKLASPEAVKQFKEKLNSYEEQINEATRKCDYDKADLIESEKEQFIKWLETEYGTKFKRKAGNIDYKRSRDAVSNAIRRAIKVIDSEIPDLAKHLRLTIKTGNQIGYYPSEQIHWVSKSPNLNLK